MSGRDVVWGRQGGRWQSRGLEEAKRAAQAAMDAWRAEEERQALLEAERAAQGTLDL